MIDMTAMKAELIQDEGIQYSAYQDSLGYLTIGVGHLIDARLQGRLPQEIVQKLLELDIDECVSDISQELWYLAVQSDHQRRGLVNMRFQLGPLGIRTFKTSLGLIAQGKFKEAGINLRRSNWYKQTPQRAERVIRMIEGG